VTLTPVPRRPPRLLEGLPPAKSTTPRTAGNSWLKTYNAPKSRWSDLADREPNDEIIFQVIGRRTSELDSGHKTLFTVITLCRGIHQILHLPCMASGARPAKAGGTGGPVGMLKLNMFASIRRRPLR